jgi:hypothetical protein
MVHKLSGIKWLHLTGKMYKLIDPGSGKYTGWSQASIGKIQNIDFGVSPVWEKRTGFKDYKKLL